MLKGLLQASQLSLDLALGQLGILDGLGLKGLNGLDLSVHVVRRGLEGLEVALDVSDDGLVLQHLAVVREIDGLGGLGERLDLATGSVVAVLESLQGGSGLATEAEAGGHLGPVELESCASLESSMPEAHTHGCGCGRVGERVSQRPIAWKNHRYERGNCPGTQDLPMQTL